jgi:hypothetical protein
VQLRVCKLGCSYWVFKLGRVFRSARFVNSWFPFFDGGKPRHHLKAM